MTFSINKHGFFLGNKKIFLNSGEIHYFRIMRSRWDEHLEAAREAGLTAVSTYIPWAWHEPRELEFDFNGRSSPERDLVGWIQRCKKHGLFCIVKPGPIILAEYRGSGLPDWFLDQYGNSIRMHNSAGERIQSDGVSLFHDKYLEKVTAWYDRIMPLISEYQISEGGPVIMLQICNETGVFSWLTKKADYSMPVRERFIFYLRNKFRDIQEVNKLWGTRYTDFSEVELPPDDRQPYASPGDRCRDYEWHRFWRTCYGDYLKLLGRLARERGITVPLFHNLPGWIYGHGYEFPVNITMYEDLFDGRSDFLFGVDHIPEFVSHRNMHDDRIINDITYTMQGGKPLFAAEFQCGSREYHVVTNPREMELFYKASIANGLTGWNYYMFSQGRNPKRKGYSGDTFYWFTPLTAEGARTSIYPLIRRMSRIVKTAENLIVEAQRKSDICVLFYPPYYTTELERPEEGACNLQFLASDIRRPAYFDGLMKALQVLNIDYDMMDLSRSTAQTLLKYKQVWAFATDEMNPGDQRTIVDLARAGCDVVLFPYLPDRDMSQQPCTIIRDALSVAPAGKEIIDSPLMDVFDLEDVKCANPLITYSESSLAGADIIARTTHGTPCGFKKTIEKGSIIHLGTWIGFETERHKAVYEKILLQSEAQLRQAFTGNGFLTVRERFTDKKAGILFIGNYYNEEQKGSVSYTHPETGETLTIPYSQDDWLWPALYGVLTPLCLEIADGLKILHSTSDILGIEMKNDQLAITIHGDRDLTGEMVLEGTGTGNIRSAAIQGKPVTMIRYGERVAFIYKHEYRKDSILEIKVI